MEFKQYPSYKKSGVEWLGGVPEHWVGSKFKYIFQEKQHTKNMNLPFGAISFGSVVYKEDKANLTDELKENYQEVLQGEFLVNPLNLNYDLKSLRTALSKIDVVVSSGYFVLKLKNNTFNKRYLEYLLYIFDIRKMKTLGAGIRQTLTFRDMAVCDVAIPSACEQTQIASFLDYETTRIDNLIAKQEKLIELLEEQRKSIISHAVTKGLNPNAPMKDSGVEWLGDVPEHWEVTFIKYITKKISSGKTPLGGAEVYTDEGVIFLRSQNIYNDGLHLDDVSFIPHEIHASMKSSAVKKNDVLLNITGGSIGRTCLVDCEIGEANVNQHVCIIRTSKDKYAKWLSVFMKSNSAQSQIFYSQTGAGREGLNFSQIGNMRLLFPPFVEQQEILDFLDQENLRFDNLILKQQSLIEKMKEYRASIISHAVTGKIDVREFGT